MKKSIDTYLKCIVKDNAEFILEGDYNSVADYIITAADGGLGYYEFFDDNELTESGEPTEEQVEDLKTYLNKYYNYLPNIN